MLQLRETALAFLQVFAAAMRGAHIADLFMTKCSAKSQQSLASAKDPFTQALERQEDNYVNKLETRTLLQRARSRVRSVIFAANRSAWPSACELSLYIRTGDVVIKSHADFQLFASKGLCMMHECKRLLNGDASTTGLLMPVRDPDDAGAAFAVHLQEAEEDTSAKESEDEDSNAANASEDEAGVPGEGDEGGQQSMAEGHRAEHCRRSLSRSTRPISPRRGSKTNDEGTLDEESMAEQIEVMLRQNMRMNIANGKPVRSPKASLFSMTFSIEAWRCKTWTCTSTQATSRERLSRIDGDLRALHARVEQFFMFARHYSMSAHFVQTLRPGRTVVRFVGPTCQRSDVNGGEEDAQYKAFLFSTVRCTGCEECANPLLFKPASAMKANGRRGIAPAWNARRAEIEVLADRAQANTHEGRRVEAIQDTIAFRENRR
ncbi:hypothetical protein N9L19_00790 [bacterium]|nr:hypothetical protein [bacterium]